MMLDAWSPIFNRYVDTTPPCYDEFCRQFPEAFLQIVNTMTPILLRYLTLLHP